MLWYYARNGQRFGPVEEAELQRLAEAGQLTGTDLVWKPGLPEWRPAGQMQELASFFRRAAPPPSPPPMPPAPMAAPAPTMVPPPTAAPAEFSPYTPPSASLTSPPAYGAPMFGALTVPEYASFGSRFAALLIDYLLMMCLGGGLGFVIGVALTTGAGGGGDLTPYEWILQLIGILVGWLYYAGLESSSQMATVGKRLLKLKVTDMEGQRISFGRATGRHFGKILSALPLGLGFFLMLSDEKKQTWHDKLSGCLVVRQR